MLIAKMNSNLVFFNNSLVDPNNAKYHILYFEEIKW